MGDTSRSGLNTNSGKLPTLPPQFLRETFRDFPLVSVILVERTTTPSCFFLFVAL